MEDCIHDAWQEAQNTGNGNKVYMYIDDSSHINNMINNTDDVGQGSSGQIEDDETE